MGRNSVGEGVTTVGVSVADTFDGRLQASIAKTSASVDNKLRDFIVSPLLLHPFIIMIPLETYPLDIGCARKVPGISSRTLNKTGRTSGPPGVF